MPSSDEDTETTKAGYRRPPKATQFKKGVSGNPKGRKPKQASTEERKADSRTVTYDIGFGRPPKHTQFQKGVSGNPYGQGSERRFVESLLAKVLFSVTAPIPERRSRSCTNMEAMMRAIIWKALEGDVVAFREVMEWVCEFGIGMQSQLAARKLSLELQSQLLEARRRNG